MLSTCRCRMGTSTLATGCSSDGQPGTVEYMAPEIYLGTGRGTAADVYSFAVVLWELTALKRPVCKPAQSAEVPGGREK